MPDPKPSPLAELLQPLRDLAESLGAKPQPPSSPSRTATPDLSLERQIVRLRQICPLAEVKMSAPPGQKNIQITCPHHISSVVRVQSRLGDKNYRTSFERLLAGTIMLFATLEHLGS